MQHPPSTDNSSRRADPRSHSPWYPCGLPDPPAVPSTLKGMPGQPFTHFCTCIHLISNAPTPPIAPPCRHLLPCYLYPSSPFPPV